jgi:hypothetical protein
MDNSINGFVNNYSSANGFESEASFEAPGKGGHWLNSNY